MTEAAIIRHKAVPAPFARMLSRVEAAGYVGVSPTTFDRMVADGLMPPAKRVYTRKLWDIQKLDTACEALPSDGPEDEPNEWD
jgi:hypothetical protein